MNNIRKAAEVIGWEYLELMAGKQLVDKENKYYSPWLNRNDLHALCGLLEDKVREKHPGLIMTVGQTCCGISIDDRFYESSNEDWLLAKLEALLKAVSDE